MSTVLCVDDEPDALFLFKVVFSGAGYEVVEAVHGRAALDRLQEIKPDLIVTDLMMPIMDGKDLIESVRANPELADIPIMLVSANPSRDIPADAIVTKPFRPSKLLEIANELLIAREAS